VSKYIKFKIYRTVILPVVPCGCENWSLTLREEHRLRVFENRVLRKIFGPKRDEVTGEWRRLRNKALSSVFLTKYHSDDQVKKTEMGRARSTYGREERYIQGFSWETLGTEPLGRPRCIWEHNIKMNLGKLGWAMDWIDLA
jgi:hypothetical protein